MGILNFKKYMNKFEKEVVCKGVSEGILGRSELVACRPGKMTRSKFVQEIGNRFSYSLPVAIVYYGYYKKSSGFFDKVKKEKTELSNRQVKMISAVVVHFASIKIEQISRITDNEYLLSKFAEFKSMLLEKRGFDKKGK